MLPMLKSRLREDRRELFLGDSKLKNFMSAIQVEDLSELEFGAFPAIEALAFVVMGLRDDARMWDGPEDESEPWDPNDWI